MINSGSPALRADSSAEPTGKPKNSGVGSLFLLQWIFLTQELNRGLQQCRRILYQLSYEGGYTSVFLITSNSFLSQRIPVWVIRPLLRPFFVAFFFLNCLHVSLLEDSGFISSAVTAGSFLKRHSPWLQRASLTMFDSPALDLIFTIPFSFSYLFLPDVCPCGTWNTKTFYSLVLAVSLIFFSIKRHPWSTKQPVEKAESRDILSPIAETYHLK